MARRISQVCFFSFIANDELFCVCVYALFFDTYLFRSEDFFASKIVDIILFCNLQVTSTVFGDEQEIAMHVGQNVMLELLKN